MKLGINLINFGPAATGESLLAWTRMAERLGYHLVMISDHVAVTPDVHARYPAPFYEPFTALGWLAAHTRTIELGTTVVILPYRHPLETARMTAAVDRLSGGRFIFGVGVGWAQGEFEALGVPFARRGAMSNEYLEAIKTCWTNDVASYQGRFVAFKDVWTTPRPLRAPHPPIWVGGASDAALRRAVLHGDAWHPIRIRLDWFRDVGVPRLRAIARELGRDVPALCPRIRLRITEAPVDESERVAGEGALEQVHADFRALEALGVRYVLLDTYTGDVEATRHHAEAWRMLALVAEQIVDLPHAVVRA
jgi:probable F420-dependent oxidoreductase